MGPRGTAYRQRYLTPAHHSHPRAISGLTKPRQRSTPHSLGPRFRVRASPLRSCSSHGLQRHSYSRFRRTPSIANGEQTKGEKGEAKRLLTKSPSTCVGYVFGSPATENAGMRRAFFFMMRQRSESSGASRLRGGSRREQLGQPRELRHHGVGLRGPREKERGRRLGVGLRKPRGKV